MIPWWAWSLVANACIQATEYINHTSDPAAGWQGALVRTFPLIVLAQYGLWASFSGASSLFLAWIVFTVGNSVMRVFMVSTFLGGEIGSWTYVLSGIATMLLGSFLVKSGLS